jgi:hypothetical protein
MIGYIGRPASKFRARTPVRRARVFSATNKAWNKTANTWNKVDTFDNVEFDTDNFWNAQLKRFIIPKGITKVRLDTGCLVSGLGTVKSNYFVFYKNGVVYNLPATYNFANSYTVGFFYQGAASAPISVVEGDYFEVWDYNTDGSITFNANQWFGLNVIEERP